MLRREVWEAERIMQISAWAGQWVNVHGKGLRDCKCPQVEGIGAVGPGQGLMLRAGPRAPAGLASELSVRVPRGPNPAQLRLRHCLPEGWPGWAITAPTGRENTLKGASVDG